MGNILLLKKIDVGFLFPDYVKT